MTIDLRKVVQDRGSFVAVFGDRFRSSAVLSGRRRRPRYFREHALVSVLIILSCALSTVGLWGSDLTKLTVLVPFAALFAWLRLGDRMGPSNDLLFAVVCVVNAVGVAHGSLIAPMLASEVIALAGWDLARFHATLESVTLVNRRSDVSAMHVRLLLVTLGTSSVVASSVLFTKVRLSFPVVVAVTLVATASLALAIYSWRSESTTN